MNIIQNILDTRIQERIRREMYNAITEVRKVDFKVRIEELIRSEMDSWKYNNKENIHFFRKQFEEQFTNAGKDPDIQALVQHQIDKVIDEVLNEQRIYHIVQNWIDEWIDEIVREQLEIRLNAKVSSMLDSILDKEDHES